MSDLAFFVFCFFSLDIKLTAASPESKKEGYPFLTNYHKIQKLQNTKIISKLFGAQAARLTQVPANGKYLTTQVVRCKYMGENPHNPLLCETNSRAYVAVLPPSGLEWDRQNPLPRLQ